MSLAKSPANMEMPGADGKMKKTEFKGMSIDAYDNVKQKFVSTWIDNMGTGVMMIGWDLRSGDAKPDLHRDGRDDAGNERARSAR